MIGTQNLICHSPTHVKSLCGCVCRVIHRTLGQRVTIRGSWKDLQTKEEIVIQLKEEEKTHTHVHTRGELEHNVY